ncbi:hypothetical protein H6CHR_03130 [Variovorax sp. PBL-H6]|uniref:hypothetical protein n=1 Tax=Variovorax sp. PBL-H6 TaxID=434009 RepID=UPI0013172585|nr:hypothetical protein [Variovorax sp. PBL-H6]VTU29122.1 hypothetical protein H6CHR_03130 [Variovorax sp. PBL-H6]
MTFASAADLSNNSYGSFQPVLDWQAAVIESLMHAQQVQLQMLTAWQRPFAAVNQELWDQWVVRFGGGVPIDG